MARHQAQPNPASGSTQSRDLIRKLYADNPIIKTSSLHLNRRGVWEIRYSQPDATGRWRSRTLSTRTTDQRDAQAQLDEWLSTAIKTPGTNGVVPKPRRMTIQTMVDAYVANGRTAQNTHLHKVCAVLGSLTADELTPEVMQAYRTQRGHLKSGSMRRELGALISALRYARKHKMLDIVPEIDMPAQSAPKIRYLTHAQESWFWDKAQAWGRTNAKHAARVALFAAIALDTAARRGAIMGLTWDRVNFDLMQIDFREPGRPVVRKRRGIVNIADRLLPVLQAAKATATSEYVLGFPDDLMFSWHQFTASIGMRWVTPHVCRHTWASLAAIDGVSLLQIAHVLSDTHETVDKYYAHLAPNDLRAVMNRPRPTRS
jgi:integrase